MPLYWMCADPYDDSVPSEEAEYKLKLQGFLAGYNNDKINEYCKIAEEDMVVYGEDYYTTKITKEALEQRKIKGTLSEINNSEEKIKQEIINSKNKIIEVQPKFWNTIGQGILSSVIFSILLILGGIVVRLGAPNSGIGVLTQYLLSPNGYHLELKKDLSN